MRRVAAALPALVVIGCCAALAASHDPKPVRPGYLDATLPAQVRAADLVGRMTLREKASQLVNQSRAIPRLHVPAYDWWNESLHGVALPGTTQFPVPMALAATFDTAAVHAMAKAIGIEARIEHVRALRARGGATGIYEGLDFFAPNLNIDIDPRWGRNEETYGEDPFLTSRLGVAYITGLQGDNRSYYLAAAVVKHFGVYSGPESTRRGQNIIANRHDLFDTYLPVFRAAVLGGRAAGIMCAYPALNGEPECANQFLLGRELRGRWQFQGVVVADCDAVTGIYESHNFTPDQPTASALAIRRGLDSECIDYFTKVDGDADYRPYLQAVKEGLLTEHDIDGAVTRLMTARIRLGLFAPADGDPYSKVDEGDLDSSQHRALALKLARESLVLLKNNGVLPLSRAAGLKVAVVGPLADQTQVLMGNYNGMPSRAVSVLEGLRKEFPHAQISYVPGTQFLRDDGSPVPAGQLSFDGRPGLQTQYYIEHYVGDNRVGVTPLTTRIEGKIDLSAKSLPPEAEGKTDLGVQWDGVLTPSESGDYMLGLEADGLIQVIVDGKEVAYDDFQGNQLERKLGNVHLCKGQRYNLEVRYAPFTHSKLAARLIWSRYDIQRPAPEAVAAARGADVVIAVVGLTAQLEGEQQDVEVKGFEGGDRITLGLPDPEEALLRAVAGTGKPLVVVLMNGGALSVNWEKKNAAAILESWYSGEEGGTAIAATLSGRNNPSGRLPATIYGDASDLPPFGNYFMQGRTYRYFTGKPLYPFGYGLSYTSFSYGHLSISENSLAAGQPLKVGVTVTNGGKRVGDEVVELYLSFPAVKGAPLRALRGFKRVHLAADESKSIQFELAPRDQSMVTEAGEIMIPDGEYTVSVGGGQPNSGAPFVSTTYRVRGSLKLPE